MQKMLRSSLSSFFYYGARCLGQKELGTRILCYHRVNDETNDYVVVPVANFRAQMQFLADEGYQAIGLSDLLDGEGCKENQGKSIVITFDDGFRDNFEYAFPILKEFGFSASIFCIGKRIGDFSYLGKGDIQEMHRSGFEFGSHTLSHPHLRDLKSSEKWEEISGSKKYLEDLLGLGINFFCYPYGEYDEEAVRFVERAGYEGACTNIPGANKEIASYLLRRTEIGAFDTIVDFRKKLAGAYDLLHRGLHWLRGRS